jgi:hypothetical protein
LLNLIYSFNDVIADNLLLSVSYYDDLGRPIRIISDNHLGKKDVIYTNYNFAGEITETTTIHNHGQSNQVKLATTYPNLLKTPLKNKKNAQISVNLIFNYLIISYTFFRSHL